MEEITASLERITEVLAGDDLSFGGVVDIRPLLARVREGKMLEGPEILEFAYTLDAAATIKRAVLASERSALAELARRLGTFDGVLHLVREQLDADGNVRDDATPKLRDIRRRLNPLRGRIRDRLQELLQTYSAHVQDAIITLRRDRYVIPIRASAQSRVPGIALDISDSGATVFIEPQSVVPLNNELALLEFEERDEVRRILIALGQRLAYQADLEETLTVLAELDLVAASTRLARDWGLVRPRLEEGAPLRLTAARHPLVGECVANDIELDDSRRLLVVTGPNAGGKTVLIKTLGLAVLMAHSGLFIAAAADISPRLPYLSALLSDIGDEQSIEASLSTYAGHLANLRAIVEGADADTLVLIDELGSGTDPAEGAALSQAILEAVLLSGARGLVTTHLAPLKVFASEAEGVRNAAMRFDIEALRPSYQLVVGQPGRSYALAIAERMGLSGELLERAAALLGPEGEKLERLLEMLEGQREALERELTEVREARDRAREEAKLLRRQIDTLRAREVEVMAAAAERADELLQDTLQRAKELRRTATSDPKERPRALKEIHRLRREARRRAAAARRPEESESSLYREGTVVRVPSYRAEGPIVAVRGDELVVQLGVLRVEVARSEVTPVASSSGPEASSAGVVGGTSFDWELNIRGERVEQGLEKVRDFILEAHALKVGKIRILHGKGTGALRDAVRSHLRREKRVERFEDAVPYEGGHGVTVAYLRRQK